MDIRPAQFFALLGTVALLSLVAALVLDPGSANLVQSALVIASLGLSFQIIFALLGQLNLGHSALFGAGAYTYAALALNGTAPALAVLAAIVLGGLAAAAVAALTARLGGAYFAVVTYALASITALIVSASPELGESEGLVGVPALPALHLIGQGSTQLLYAGACYALVLTGFWLLWRSRLGHALEAIRSHYWLATALGINVTLVTILATAAAGILAGFAGATFAQNARFVSPDVFGLYYVITPLSAVAIGGYRSLLGSLLGSVIVVIVPLELAISPIINQVIAGMLLVIFIILFPAGIAGWLHRLLGRRRPATVAIEAGLSDAAASGQAEADNAEPILTVRDLSVRYGGVHAVRGVSLTLRRGEIVGLIGANGAGKSSFVNGLSGIVRVTGGFIELGGITLPPGSGYLRARHGLSRTFQNTILADTLTVGDSLRLAAAAGRMVAERADPIFLAQTLSACGLERLADRKVSELSYMHRRLTALGMALVTRPLVVLLDEATAGLTREERGQIGRLITRLAAQWRTAFLVIEHDVEFVASIAVRIVVMNDGALLREGAPQDVLRDPAVVASYLGSDWHVAASAGA